MKDTRLVQPKVMWVENLYLTLFQWLDQVTS